TLRRNETDSADLTEEIALFMEIDRKLWSQLFESEQQALFKLAEKLDVADTLPEERLKQSLTRLNAFSQRRDDADTWSALADQLKKYPKFKTENLDLKRLKDLRANLLPP